MAYAKPRSMNNDLECGMVDGTYKRICPNRGGVVEYTTDEAQQDLYDIWYGKHEADHKHLPDGRVNSNDKVANAPAQIGV